MLEKYEREAEAEGNRVGIAEQILSATRDLQKAIGREEKLPTLFPAYVRALKAVSIGDDIKAMPDTETEFLKELVALGQKYVKGDELFNEINDPAIADKMPDISPEDLGNVAEQLEHIANSEDASEHFSDEGVEILNSETQEPAKEDGTERKLRFARITGLADALKRAMAPYAAKAKHYAKKAPEYLDKGQDRINKVVSWTKTYKKLGDFIEFIKKIFDNSPDV